MILKEVSVLEMSESNKDDYYHHQIPVSVNHEDYDGRKDVWFERTFRFRNINELSHLYTRERARIIKAQKDREDFEKYWYNRDFSRYNFMYELL